MRSRSRFNPIVVLVALLHVYIGVRLLAPFGLPVQLLGAAVLAACVWLLPKGFHVPEGRGPWAVLLPWVTMGFFSWLLVLTLARDASLAVAALVFSPAAHDAWTRASAIAVMVLTPAITLIGFV